MSLSRAASSARRLCLVAILLSNTATIHADNHQKGHAVGIAKDLASHIDLSSESALYLPNHGSEYEEALTVALVSRGYSVVREGTIDAVPVLLSVAQSSGTVDFTVIAGAHLIEGKYDISGEIVRELEPVRVHLRARGWEGLVSVRPAVTSTGTDGNEVGWTAVPSARQLPSKTLRNRDQPIDAAPWQVVIPFANDAYSLGPVGTRRLSAAMNDLVPGDAIQLHGFSQGTTGHRQGNRWLAERRLRTVANSLQQWNPSIRIETSLTASGVYTPGQPSREVILTVERSDEPLLTGSSPRGSTSVNPERLQNAGFSSTDSSSPLTVGWQEVRPALRNLMDTGGVSNFAGEFDAASEIARVTLVFANDSLRLGPANKALLAAFVEKSENPSDLYSILGCSHGPTALDNGNAMLSTGRANRVKEQLLFLGVGYEQIRDEACWATVDNPALPARGVVLTRFRAN